MNIFKAIRDRLAKIDEVVPVLVFFEIIYLAIGQLIIWAFLPVDKPYVALGFAIGVGFAMISSIQNSMILGRALSKGKKRAASAGMVIFMLIRIAAISVIVVLALLYKFCSPVAVLIGVLAIQAGVYFEPMVRKRREKKAAQERVNRISTQEGLEKNSQVLGVHKWSDKKYYDTDIAQDASVKSYENSGTQDASDEDGSPGVPENSFDETGEQEGTQEYSDKSGVSGQTDNSFTGFEDITEDDDALADTDVRQGNDLTDEEELQKNVQEDAQGSEGDRNR